MKLKHIAALATMAALITAAAPALAVTTKTATVTVKWNTSAIASLTLHTDYSATGAFGAAASPIVNNLNTGSGSCTTPGATHTDGTVDFGAVSPDFSVFTDCLYENAVNAVINTNSTSWSLGVAATAGYPASGFALCALPNGVTFGAANGATLSATQTTRTTNASVPAITTTASCPAGDVLMNAAGTTTNLINGNTNAFGGTAANVGMDIELAIANNAPTGAQSVTETYTLTAN